MRTWKNAEIVEIDIAETAYGKNDHAREANAGKKPNNGAGIPDQNDFENDFNKDPETPTENLS